MAFSREVRVWKNLRIGEAGRDLRRSSSPIPLLKQVSYNRSCKKASRWVVNIYRRLYNLSGQSVPGLHHPYHKEVLIDVCLELPMPLFLVLSLRTPRRAWSHPFASHLPVAIYEH